MSATNQNESALIEAIEELFQFPVWKTVTFESKTRDHATLTIDTPLHPYITYFQCRLYYTVGSVIIETEVGCIGELVNRVWEDEMKANSIQSAIDGALADVTSILSDTIQEIDRQTVVLSY